MSTSLSEATVGRYLERLGVPKPDTPTLGALRALQAAHLREIPFENASVLRGDQIPLDLPSLVDKVLGRGRGGFCYELNGLFAALLEALGYTVFLRSARVFQEGATVGPPFDHLCLEVPLDGERWLVDVGFGYSFLEPLRLMESVEQEDPSGRFRLLPVAGSEGAVDVEWLHSDGSWRGQYRIDPGTFALADFEPMCEVQRTSADAPFVHGWMLSRATADGFVTIMHRKYILSRGKTIVDSRIVDDDTELGDLVARWFGL